MGLGHLLLLGVEGLGLHLLRVECWLRYEDLWVCKLPLFKSKVIVFCDATGVAVLSERPVEIATLGTGPVSRSDLSKNMSVFDSKSFSLFCFLLSSQFSFLLCGHLNFLDVSKEVLRSSHVVSVIERLWASLTDLSSLKVVVGAAAALPPTVWEPLSELYPRLFWDLKITDLFIIHNSLEVWCFSLGFSRREAADLFKWGLRRWACLCWHLWWCWLNKFLTNNVRDFWRALWNFVIALRALFLALWVIFFETLRSFWLVVDEVQDVVLDLVRSVLLVCFLALICILVFEDKVIDKEWHEFCWFIFVFIEMYTLVKVLLAFF